MNSVQILRLKNGEDIIGIIEEDTINGILHISDPMHFHLDYKDNKPNLVMAHWLPIQIIKSNETSIKSEEVLTKFEPNDDFVEYYMDTVQKIQEVVNTRDSMESLSDQELMDMLDSLKDLKNQTIH